MLSLDGPAQVEIVLVAPDEQRLDDLSERLERLAERMLAGTGIEPPEDVRSGVFLEFDGRGKPQRTVPVLADQGVLARLLRLDAPASFRPSLLPEDVEGQLAIALDVRAKERPSSCVSPNMASVHPCGRRWSKCRTPRGTQA